MSKLPGIPKPTVYLASPLFSEAERAYNLRVRKRLSPFVRVYLPQTDGGLMADMIECGADPRLASETVFRSDILALQSCDALIIILDGPSVDEGAAFELGYFYASRRPCFGLQTDTRRRQGTSNNPMIALTCVPITTTLGQLGRVIRRWSEAVTRNLPVDNADKARPPYLRVAGRSPRDHPISPSQRMRIV
jgi:nucleoside 2-deoxyribosyltransferase